MGRLLGACLLSLGPGWGYPRTPQDEPAGSTPGGLSRLQGSPAAGETDSGLPLGLCSGLHALRAWQGRGANLRNLQHPLSLSLSQTSRNRPLWKETPYSTCNMAPALRGQLPIHGERCRLLARAHPSHWVGPPRWPAVSRWHLPLPQSQLTLHL